MIRFILISKKYIINNNFIKSKTINKKIYKYLNFTNTILYYLIILEKLVFLKCDWKQYLSNLKNTIKPSQDGIL